MLLQQICTFGTLENLRYSILIINPQNQKWRLIARTILYIHIISAKLRYLCFSQYIFNLILQLFVRLHENDKPQNGTNRKIEKPCLWSIPIYFGVFQFGPSIEINKPLYLYNYMLLFVIQIIFMIDIHFIPFYSILISLFN